MVTLPDGGQTKENQTAASVVPQVIAKSEPSVAIKLSPVVQAAPTVSGNAVAQSSLPNH